MATSRTLRRAYDLRLGVLGLNLSEAILLGYVSEHGPMTQTQLAARLMMGRPSLGAVVDSLERRGLVERQRHPTDRRVWLVANTPDGDRLVPEIDAMDQKLRIELRSGISRAERQALAEALMRLQSNLRSILSDEPSPDVPATETDIPATVLPSTDVPSTDMKGN